jgi:hypothetical protein
MLREESLLTMSKEGFIRSFAKNIRVTGDTAVLTYSIPELPDNVSLEDVGVPRFVQYGGR